MTHWAEAAAGLLVAVALLALVALLPPGSAPEHVIYVIPSA